MYFARGVQDHKDSKQVFHGRGAALSGAQCFSCAILEGDKQNRTKLCCSSGAWNIPCFYSSNSTPDSQHAVAENVDFLKQVGTSTQSVLTLPCTPVYEYIDMVVSLNFRNLMTPHC